jgi:uncharacterized delta-60 repeat protein
MKTRTRRRLALIHTTFALAAALSACSDNNDAPPPAPVSTTDPPSTPAPTPDPPSTPAPTPDPPSTPTPTPPPTPFTMTLSTDRQPVEQGHTEHVTVSIIRDASFTGSVEIAISGLPGGASGASFVIPATSTSADLVLQADPAAAHSLPTLTTVTGTGGGSSAQKPLTVTVRGHAGAVDTSFAGGINVTPIGTSEDFAHAVAVQTDGAVLVAGSSAFVTGTDFSVVRYGRDGGLDATFGNGGKVTTEVASGNGSDEAYAVAVQPNGKILVAGGANMGSNASGIDFALVRYNADGTLDTTFGNGGKVTTAIGTGTDRAYAILLQPDGRIVLGGDSEQATSGIDFALVRYDTNGSLDTSFGNGGIVTTSIANSGGRDSIYALSSQTVAGESRIVAVGGEGDFAVARYTMTGALDAGFGNGGKVRGLFGSIIGAARGVVATADGKLVVAGQSGHDHALVRLLPDGVLDVSFGTAGRSVVAVSASNWDEVTALVQQADGKLVTAGWTYTGNSSSGDYVVTRFTVEGALDAGFGNGGIVITPTAPGTKSDAAQAVALQADDRVPTVRSIVAGSRNDSNNDFSVVRYWH